MNFIEANWQAPKHIRALTTLRHFFKHKETDGDDLKKTIPLPDEPIWLHQVHGANCVLGTPDNRHQSADASYTQKEHCVLAITTADCLPIFITDLKGTQIAAIHAGWRGLAQGVIETTMANFNKNHPLRAWLGPAISQTHFEVGEDVFSAFVQRMPVLEKAFQVHANGKWKANLYLIAELILQKEGVHDIQGGDFCTYSQPDLFFSYRRDKNETGRMASLIWIDKKK